MHVPTKLTNSLNVSANVCPGLHQKQVSHAWQVTYFTNFVLVMESCSVASVLLLCLGHSNVTRLVNREVRVDRTSFLKVRSFFIK